MTGKKRKRTVYTHNANAPANTTASTASTASTHRINREIHTAPPVSPTKERTFDMFDAAMGYHPDEYTGVTADGPAAIKIKGKKVYENSTHPVKTWIPKRDQYADGLIQREGRGPWWSQGCAGCDAPSPTWRCEDCFGSRMLCRACVTQRHRDEPLHVLQEWQDNFFQSRGSKDLGLRFQIGHRKGEDCPLVPLSHLTTLSSWTTTYPATSKDPQTAATLSLLRRFHTLNLQARLPAYDFYNSLALLRNGSGLRAPPSRLPQFMHMVREYRHLQMCKRAGRIHDITGLAGTALGELAVACRACPLPGINLPEGWEDAPPEIAWIYRLLLSEDANFKMKGRDRSTRDKDPTLGPGWAYMVANDDYLKHLVQYVDQDEVGDVWTECISHCVSFAALWSANNKRAKGLRASGVGSVSCSRHELFRPRGTGDLQKGEKYSNMDYLFFSSLIGITLLTVVASYDIACQWARNFWARASAMPANLKLPAGLTMLFKVPKFHLPPHVKSCHGPYSFNYTKGVGRTDGEGVERNWSWLNGAAQSVSVMGPGSREDTIDDLCGFSNWRKTVDLGNSLLRKLVLAIPQAMIHSRAFHAFTDGLRGEHEGELRDWDALIREWEQDPLGAVINPFDYPAVEAETMADVMKRISEEDHARVVKDGAGALQVKPAGFLLAGIDIQEDQLAVALEAKRRTRTTIQATDLQRKRTVLLGKVAALQDVQNIYMPGLHQWIAQQEPALPAPDNSKPETIKIFLPSALPAAVRETVCLPELTQNEDNLRQAQAGDALRELRSNLRTRTFAHQFKRKHMGGQGMYTKSQSLQDGIEDRIRSAGARYRAAWAGLLALRGPGKWQTALQELRPEDVRGINERAMNDEEKEDNRKARLLAGLTGDGSGDVDEYGESIPLTVLFNLETGEGTRQSSWLWYSAMGVGEVDADGKLHADIRVEWSKARARADRWREEVVLVEEEMRRTIEYCRWKARWWEERLELRRDVAPALAEGLRAYGLEQVARERAWAASWDARWRPVRARAAMVLRDHVEDVDDQVFAPIEVDLEEDAREDYEFDDFNEEEAD
ncbi:hypothetical protein B0H16DRAFT_1465657 [Mycena metata]|uniref:CxC2-like cysteine cluster KDZ transposase-associated domain-containing protein n=1 Tax=Mycena metata TaxID=1033252 RepID=A0AAD7MYQ3_9AGAR|nr:hypothetical protein B0H16DRAFT_1465657 [Mycena metata]